MADDKLPSDYDAIVLGTGMTECIVAAALSRIGQSVLHLDRNDYYSGDWASFHFESLRKWIAQQKCEVEHDLTVCKGHDLTTLLQEGETTLPLTVHSDTISSVIEQVHVMNDRPEELPAEESNHDNRASVPTLSEVCQAKLSSPAETHTNAQSVINEGHVGATTNCRDTDVATNTAEVDKLATTLDALTTSSVEESTPVSSVDDVTEVIQQACVTDESDTRQTMIDESISEVKQPTFGEILKQYRKFSIDLMPKVLYCRGSMVELLIKSDIAKYCEFKSVTRVLTLLDGKLQQVPCSRADVFASKQVTMVEKRMLMKLLSFCVNYQKHPDEYKDYEGKTFAEFLQSRKLTANVRHYVKNSIAMATDETSTIDGLKSTQRFLQSLGRYGNTAFLWPLYGSGELPQCFCRMCAVFGGVYCLRRTAQSLIVNASKRCTGIIDTEGQRLNCRWLVMEASYASSEVFPQRSCDRGQISRGILITNSSIQPTTEEQITLMRLPVGDGRSQPVTIYELSPCSMACPSGFYLVHLTCLSTSDAESDLKSTVKQLFHMNDGEDADFDVELSKPRVLWSLYFNMADSTSSADLHCDVADNVVVVSGPDSSLDYEHSIAEARRIFEQICGTEEEFLPAAPNPEDIIYDYGEGKTPVDSGFASGDAEGEKEDGTGNGVDISWDSGTEVGRAEGEKVGGTGNGVDCSGDASAEAAQVEKTVEGGKEGSDALLELGGSEGATGNVEGDT